MKSLRTKKGQDNSLKIFFIYLTLSTQKSNLITTRSEQPQVIQFKNNYKTFIKSLSPEGEKLPNKNENKYYSN